MRNYSSLLISILTFSVLFTDTLYAQVSTVTYNCTGAPIDFVVPPCVTEIAVKCWGAGGGGGGADSYSGGVGGGGSYVTAVITTTPGETITVFVGCQGFGGAGCSGGAPGGSGGWGYGIAGNGGNAGPSGCSGAGGGGGGSSAVARGGTVLIGAAGGGGGGGGGCTSLGGFGGYGTTNGSNTSCTTGGATAASGNSNGTNGGTMNQDGGGGGGGGGGVTNGGNGGSAPPPGPSCNSANDCGAGGAGAGNSFTPLGGTLSVGTGQAPGNNTDPDLCAGCGNGGGAQAIGGDGMVVLTFNSAPTADFAAASVCFGNSVTFTDLSFVAVAGWAWDFGDATTSSLQSPTHNYTAPGAFTVSLIVTDSCGGTDTTSQNIDIHQLPATSFSGANVCAYDTSMFTDNTVYPGTITWAWNFGDGATDTLQSPTHYYTAFGTYSVVLTTVSDSGCTNTYTVPYEVHPVPAASFTTLDVCRYTPASFTNLSSLAGTGSIDTWLWDFGDGQVGTVQTPTNSYAAPGNYTVTLITISDSLCSDTTTQNIEIYPVPVADFGSGNVCTDAVATFTDLSTITGVDPISTWAWDFGDGVTSTTASTTHIYNPYGTYNVQLTVNSINGCTNVKDTIIVIHPLPVASYTVIDTCIYDSAAFNNTTTLTPGNIVSWSWDFGDGNSSTLKSPSNLYSNYGTYTVDLIALSDSGCTDIGTGSVTIYPQPIMGFIPTSPAGCSEFCITFSDQTQVPNDVPVAWLWDFGDGSSSTEQNPKHCYTNSSDIPLALPVELIATSTNGCLDTINRTAGVTIYPLPIAEFDLGPQPATLLFPFISFTNQSTGNVDTPTTYIWDFGDTSGFWTGIDTVHVYDGVTPGIYMVEMTVSNQWGCADTIQHEVFIDQDYTFFAPNAFTPDYDGINDYFMVQGIGLENLLEFEMFIYNRWGDLIYYYNVPNDPTWRGWDGWANGGKKLAQRDVYIWEIKTRDRLLNGYARHHYIGHVTLLR